MNLQDTLLVTSVRGQNPIVTESLKHAQSVIRQSSIHFVHGSLVASSPLLHSHQAQTPLCSRSNSTKWHIILKPKYVALNVMKIMRIGRKLHK
jgi:hypothetical protein